MRPLFHKFICLTVRDEKYKKQFSSNKFTDPKYWNYQNFRNAKIENYYHVAQELLDRNYWVIRMGKITSREMIIKNDKFLDYSFSSYRDDFLDMWLMANCFFSISNSTGIDEVAKAFRKPIVNTDFALYGLPNLNLYS